MKMLNCISLALALVLTLPSGVALAADRARASPMAAFTDCDMSAWYRPAIEYAVEYEVMRGVGSGQMAPDRLITRAEFVTMVCRLLDPRAGADVSRYEDLPDDAWYYEPMRLGLQLGIVRGISHTRTAPDRLLTREQAAVILARVLALPDGDLSALGGVKDRDAVSDWALGSVSAMAAAGLLRGYPDGTLKPMAPITRAEVAQLLLNCFPSLVNAGNVSDLPYRQAVILREDGLGQDVTLTGLHAQDALLLAPCFESGKITLKDCQAQRVVCWGGGDIYIYPGCTIGEIALARTDGPVVVHWLGPASSLPNIAFTDGCHPDCRVVDQYGAVLEPAEGSGKPTVVTVARPMVYFVPQNNGSGRAYPKAIDSDGYVQPMEPPAWEGHVFGGWYTEPECETRFSFRQTVAQGLRLYGKWYTQEEWEVVAQLNAAANAGAVRVYCETDLLATIGKDKLPCQIRSGEANMPLRVELVRADTGTVVAIIDHLSPGETATEMTVVSIPEYGNYNARLVFRDSGGTRQAEVEATLYVAYLWNRGE